MHLGFPVIKHTLFQQKNFKSSFVWRRRIFSFTSAIAAGAQVYITSDIKYHEFFDADEQDFTGRYRPL